MRFEAIVHAPTLRAGARLNIAECDQSEFAPPERLEVGSELWLRFGVCCPDLSRGMIVAYGEGPESVILAIGSESWTLLKGDGGGVTEPGIVSEDWYVAPDAGPLGPPS